MIDNREVIDTEIDNSKNTIHVVGRYDTETQSGPVWFLTAIFEDLLDALNACETENDFVLIDFPVNQAKKEEYTTWHNAVYPLIDMAGMNYQLVLEDYWAAKVSRSMVYEFIDHLREFSKASENDVVNGTSDNPDPPKGFINSDWDKLGKKR